MPPVSAESASKQKEGPTSTNPKALDFGAAQPTDEKPKRLRKMKTTDAIAQPEPKDAGSKPKTKTDELPDKTAKAKCSAKAKAKAKGQAVTTKQAPQETSVEQPNQEAPSEAHGVVTTLSCIPAPVPNRVTGKQKPEAANALCKVDTSTPARKQAEEQSNAVQEAMARSATQEFVPAENVGQPQPTPPAAPTPPQATTSPILSPPATSPTAPANTATAPTEKASEKESKTLNTAEKRAAHARFMRFRRSLESQNLNPVIF